MSQTIRENVRLLAPYLAPNDIVVLCSKGIEEGTGKRLSQVVLDEAPDVRVVALYGPSHAGGSGSGIPTHCCGRMHGSGSSHECSGFVYVALFRVYTSSDIIGAGNRCRLEECHSPVRRHQ